MERTSPDPQKQTSNTQQQQVEALGALLSAYDLDAADLLSAIQNLAAAKAAAKDAATETPADKSIYQDKENIYDDEHAFIYRRGDTVKRPYYLRIYDESNKNPFIRSLRTTDRIKAIATARSIYQEVKGKLERGERIKSITSEELIKIYLEKIKKRITDIPKQGITAQTYRNKEYYLRNWLEYISEIGYKDTPIDAIKPDKTRDFGIWLLNKPKQQNSPKSTQRINSNITEVKHFYREVAVRDRYISSDKIPEIDRLKEQPDEGYKRDIFTKEQYDKFWRFMLYNWIKEKEITHEEKQKRIIYYHSTLILYHTGLRPKEYLGLRYAEITNHKTDDIKDIDLMKIVVRRENSKTGRSRIVIAPIRKRVEAIQEAYAALGVELTPQDYIALNPQSKNRSAYTRQALYDRLKSVLEKSGLQEELDAEGKKVSLYSSRHAYISWRLLYGNTPIHLVAKAAGTSIQKIEKTYGHIEVEKQAELLTRNQGFSRKAKVDLLTEFDEEKITFTPDLNILEERLNRLEEE